MVNSIVAQPNQSILDIILQGCGSLEAGMQFLCDNNIGISGIVLPGTVYTLSNEALLLGDPGTLNYLRQNGIILGTLSGGIEGYVEEDGSDTYSIEDGSDEFIPE